MTNFPIQLSQGGLALPMPMGQLTQSQGLELCPYLLLSLAHTLLIPSLSNKLMSVSQITEELNCVVLIYFSFCLLQDVLSKEIIGCGTKRGDCTTWMTSTQAEQITRTIKSVAMNDIFGYGIGAWGTHRLAISGIHSHLYFPICRM